MATVVIDDVDEIQVEGTTLMDMQAQYPNCWLKRDDNVSIRVQSYVLQGGRRYILHKVNPSSMSIVFHSMFSSNYLIK
jgi:hypothetical protein